jgi:gas vesicle protein
MVRLLVGFVLGVIVGASSWLLVAAWLESKRVGRDPGGRSQT